MPVAIHFDHGLTYEKCLEALELGFTSVMYDCSTDSYMEDRSGDYHDIRARRVAAIRDVVKDKIRLFGSENRA